MNRDAPHDTPDAVPSFFSNRYARLEQGFRLVVHNNKFLRINTLKGSEAEIVARLRSIGVTLRPTPLPLCYAYEAPFALSSTTEHLIGMFYLQNLASQAVAHALAPQPGWTVIDMAAAPGSKTTHIAQMMLTAKSSTSAGAAALKGERSGGTAKEVGELPYPGWTGRSDGPAIREQDRGTGQSPGYILAIDKNPNRLTAVRDNCERLGIPNVVTLKKDARFLADLKVQADAILLDAPCSGNYCSDDTAAANTERRSPKRKGKERGHTQGREMDARAEHGEAQRGFGWFAKRRIEDVRQNARVQKELFKAAMGSLKPGGALVYSTCSLEPEEDELVVQWALEKYPNLKLEEITLPEGLKLSPGVTAFEEQQLSPSLALTRRSWPYKTGTEGFFLAKFRNA